MDAFRDRIAVITGAASGIGRAMAGAFARRGARLVLADINEESLAQAEKELAASGATVLPVHCDVTRRESVVALADRACDHYGRVHVVCNNAGVAVLGTLADATPADWEATMAINFWGVAYGVDAFLPRLIAQGEGGHIVNTASMAGLVGMEGFGIYCASKFAVVGLTESLHRECRPHDIGVSVLCPMIVATNIAENTRRVLGRSPLGPTVAAAPAPTAADGAGRPRGGVVTADEVGERVVVGIDRRDLYIFTHPEQRDILRRRASRQDAMFEDDSWSI
ncbi:MAG: SDR family NAD(P)-dependent oxidoreductase [Myxococcales bacterium]|nr:SDR family NAD(P)-dependent oxidoreductase [Myxococcales bacterium]